MDAELMTLAEEFTLHLPARRHFLREVTPRYVLTTGNSGATVVRIRLGPGEVERALAEVRARLATEDVHRCEWWCGAGTQPRDLPERLLALGLEPDDEAATLTVMTLDRPPEGTPQAEVRRVETFDDYVVWSDVANEGWGHEEEHRARLRARAELNWRSTQEQDAALYLAYLDGEPVGNARAFFLDRFALLLGASVVPASRGRGAYLALVHARWNDAVARGTPRLLIQAGDMSRPILERVGFRALGEIRLLLDRL